MNSMINSVVKVICVMMLVPLNSCILAALGLIDFDHDEEPDDIQLCIENRSDSRVRALIYTIAVQDLDWDYFDRFPLIDIPANCMHVQVEYASDYHYFQFYFKQDSIVRDCKGYDSLRYVIMRHALYDHKSFKAREYSVSYPDDCVTDSIVAVSVN